MKKFFYLITIFLIVGIWLGLNFAYNQPYFSNPFAEKELREKTTEKVESMTRGAKDAVERTIDRTINE